MVLPGAGSRDSTDIRRLGFRHPCKDGGAGYPGQSLLIYRGFSTKIKRTKRPDPASPPFAPSGATPGRASTHTLRVQCPGFALANAAFGPAVASACYFACHSL